MQLPVGTVRLEGRLAVPPRPRGMVVFPHQCAGCGPGRVASSLLEAGLATLHCELLTAAERSARTVRFDLPLLAGRLGAAVERVGGEESLRGLPLGIFADGTGAAAALLVAAERGGLVRALVSLCGRTDLAGDALEQVLAPTLLIVGGNDHPILEINRRSYRKLRAPSELVEVPSASHLFEEPGAPEEVSCRARDWFLRFLPRGAPCGGARQSSATSHSR